MIYVFMKFVLNLTVMWQLTFFSSPSLWTKALLQEAHEVEVKKQKDETKIERQLAVNREDTATEVQLLC